MSRRVRVGRGAAGGRGAGGGDPTPTTSIRSRRRSPDRSLHAARLLPPQPAEHVHRQADGGDDGGGVRAGAGGGGVSVLRSLRIADPPERWADLGFSISNSVLTLGEVTLELGGDGEGVVAWSLP